MACLEGIDLGQYVRGMFASFLEGKLYREIEKKIPILALTDCRSLYDHLHLGGLPGVPSDRRLAIDIACLRQLLESDAKYVPAGLAPD